MALLELSMCTFSFFIVQSTCAVRPKSRLVSIRDVSILRLQSARKECHGLQDQKASTARAWPSIRRPVCGYDRSNRVDVHRCVSAVSRPPQAGSASIPYCCIRMAASVAGGKSSMRLRLPFQVRESLDRLSVYATAYIHTAHQA